MYMLSKELFFSGAGIRRCRLVISLWLFVSLIFSPFVLYAEEGLAFKAKSEISQKIEQVKDPVWVTTKLGSSAAGSLAGKVTGLGGMAIGSVIGLAVGGPAGGAVGAIIGARIVSIMTKAYIKPLAAEAINAGLNDEPVSLSEIWQTLDKKRLTVEGASAVAGSFVGEAIGIALGTALFAGAGPFAIPIIGAISGDIIGGKIGRWIGSYLAKKAGGKAYAALSPQPPPIVRKPASISREFVSSDASSISLSKAQADYERAYRSYVNSLQDSNADSKDKAQALSEYKKALETLSAVQKASQKR